MAFVPGDILSSISSTNTAASDVFTNVQQTIQNVGSIWDSITGKADAVPKTTITPVPITAPTPPPTPTVTPEEADKTTMYALIGVGVLAVLGIFILSK